MFSKHFIKGVLGLGLAALAGHSAQANPADWHLNLGGTSFDTNNTALWVPYGNPATTTNPNNANAASYGQVNGIDYTIWDNYGPHGNGSTGNHHNLQDFGGQNFDAKAMFSRSDSSNLYVGLVTGFNPAGLTIDGVSYKMGDLAINPDFANKTSQFGVVTLSGSAPTSGTTSLYAGGAWNVPNGAQGWSGPPLTNLAGGGTLIGNDIRYTYTDLGVSYHDVVSGTNVEQYLLEWSIPLNEVGAKVGQDFSISWGPSCGNDIIQTRHTVTAVPEPASFSILGGLGVLALSRRRSRKVA